MKSVILFLIFCFGLQAVATPRTEAEWEQYWRQRSEMFARLKRAVPYPCISGEQAAAMVDLLIDPQAKFSVWWEFVGTRDGDHFMTGTSSEVYCREDKPGGPGDALMSGRYGSGQIDINRDVFIGSLSAAATWDFCSVSCRRQRPENSVR